MLEAAARYFCPGCWIGTAGTQIGDRAIVAQALHRIGQAIVAGRQMLEILAADFQKIDLSRGAHRGGARSAAQQGHLAERLSWPERGELVLASPIAQCGVDQNLDGSL